MINVPHFIVHVIRPALNHIGLGGRASEELLLGTALQESNLQYLHQLGEGPAKGVFQMEPRTHDDIWQNYLAYKKQLAQQVLDLSGQGAWAPPAEQLCGNMYYAAAMTRVHYRRVPEALPAAGDIEAQADYWKRFYNTHLGAGTVEEYIENWQEGTFRLNWPE